MKYEYKIITVHQGYHGDDEFELNVEGQLGWKLVAIQPDTSSIHHKFILMREYRDNSNGGRDYD